jgi:hypothetical protein
LPIEAKLDTDGREQVSPYVTLQTGEQPDDRFFDRGRIVITTYDQLLAVCLISRTAFPKDCTTSTPQPSPVHSLCSTSFI